VGSGRERHERGKHRTEVTEVTEGDWIGGEILPVDTTASGAGTKRMGKASHGGHGGGLDRWRSSSGGH
jgi:hypothetical protein